jgi:hypothetical protein
MATMRGRAGDLFPRFLREFVRPSLKPRGYTQAGRTYRKTQPPATAHLLFLRYTGAHAGRFDVRMMLTLDPYTSELGPLVVEDLSRHVYGSVLEAPWRWPCEESEWPALASRLLGSVTAGTDWIESLFPLPALAAYLEGQRRFASDADEERLRIEHAMTSAGITTLYQSPGYASSRAGQLRPDKVAALSYCYEAMGAWDKALDAWRDYVTTLRDPSNPEHPSVRQAHNRRSYLEERSRA